MKRFLISIALVIFAAENAAAGCCSCVGSAHAKTDMLITREHTSTRTTISREGAMIREKMEEVGSVLQQEARSQTAAQQQMFAAHNQFLEDLFKAAGIAEQKLKFQREYGDKSMPPGGCEGVDLGAGIQNNQKVRLKIEQETLKMAADRTEQYIRAKDQKTEMRHMLDMAPAPGKLASAMFESAVQDAELKAVMESIFYLSDPVPPRKLTDQEKAHPQAIDYEAERSLRNRHMAVVQQILAEHAARRIPSMPLEAWAKDHWERMGGQGSPPGLVDGQMSTNSVIDALVDSRIGNPNWLTVTVPGLNAVGLARERLFMEAANLYMQREQMRMIEQLVVLTALNTANQITSHSDERIRQLKIKMEN